MSILYYYETETCDYLAVNTETKKFYRPPYNRGNYNGGADMEGRATAISGLVTSVCTTGVAQDFLESRCERVPLREVPDEWIKAIGYHNLKEVKRAREDARSLQRRTVQSPRT